MGVCVLVGRGVKVHYVKSWTWWINGCNLRCMCVCLCVCVCVCVCVIVQNIKSCSSWVYVCNRRCKCVGGEESECSLCEIVNMVNKRVSFKVFVCGGGGRWVLVQNIKSCSSWVYVCTICRCELKYIDLKVKKTQSAMSKYRWNNKRISGSMMVMSTI